MSKSDSNPSFFEPDQIETKANKIEETKIDDLENLIQIIEEN